MSGLQNVEALLGWSGKIQVESCVASQPVRRYFPRVSCTNPEYSRKQNFAILKHLDPTQGLLLEKLDGVSGDLVLDD